MPDNWDWIIGEVLGPFGRIGELKVRVETDTLERFQELTRICLHNSSGASVLFDVENSRIHKGRVLLKLKGVDSISEAELWRNATVRTQRQERYELEENHFYVSDLIGMEVVTSTGMLLGRLEEVLPYPAQDLLKIGDVLIPVVKEYIHSVDLERGRITVLLPKGFLQEEPDEMFGGGDAPPGNDRTSVQSQHHLSSSNPRSGANPHSEPAKLRSGSASYHRRHPVRRGRGNDPQGRTDRKGFG
jgi:16S rRNA processing protein RimM